MSGPVAAPALQALLNLVIGLLILAVGVGYDLWEREPGRLTLAGLALLGGPGLLVALARARGLLGGDR